MNKQQKFDNIKISKKQKKNLYNNTLIHILFNIRQPAVLFDDFYSRFFFSSFLLLYFLFQPSIFAVVVYTKQKKNPKVNFYDVHNIFHINKDLEEL
jgi:hypothetical protein